jgi:RHH-type transcriptional regulator, rel operon repressor / antitoxin RelB
VAKEALIEKMQLCTYESLSISHERDMSAADATVITTRINAGLRARLEALACSTKRCKSFLAAEAIAAYVELNEWQIGEITAGLAEFDSGEALSQRQAEERYNRLLQRR